MCRIRSQCLDAEYSDRSARSDVLLREEPDEEEDDEDDEGNVRDDEGNDEEEDEDEDTRTPMNPFAMVFKPRKLILTGSLMKAKSPTKKKQS